MCYMKHSMMTVTDSGKPLSTIYLRIDRHNETGNRLFETLVNTIVSEEGELVRAARHPPLARVILPRTRKEPASTLSPCWNEEPCREKS